MILDINKFTEHVPTAEGSDLNALIPFTEEAEQWLRESLLGDALHDLIAGLDETADLKRCAQTAVCLKAYETAIPFLDLTQTPNGFAVVNNSNHAPASKERAERLLNFVARRLSTALDSVIHRIHPADEYREEWKKSPAFASRTEIVFLTVQELRNYSGNKDAGYRDLETSHPMILGFQADIAKHISQACLDELLQKKGNYELSSREERVFRSIQTIIGLQMQNRSFYPLIEGTINYMITFPEEFPAYINSPEYRIKISPRYENKRDHSTFFFG